MALVSSKKQVHQNETPGGLQGDWPDRGLPLAMALLKSEQGVSIVLVLIVSTLVVATTMGVLQMATLSAQNAQYIATSSALSILNNQLSTMLSDPTKCGYALQSAVVTSLVPPPGYNPNDNSIDTICNGDMGPGCTPFLTIPSSPNNSLGTTNFGPIQISGIHLVPQGKPTGNTDPIYANFPQISSINGSGVPSVVNHTYAMRLNITATHNNPGANSTTTAQVTGNTSAIWLTVVLDSLTNTHVVGCTSNFFMNGTQRDTPLYIPVCPAGSVLMSQENGGGTTGVANEVHCIQVTCPSGHPITGFYQTWTSGHPAGDAVCP